MTLTDQLPADTDPDVLYEAFSQWAESQALPLYPHQQEALIQVIMDEFHFYAEPDRGWAWQVPLLELPKAQFVLMSATLGDVARFEEDLTRRTGRQTAVVRNAERPVPLLFSYVLTPLHETLEE